MKREELDYTIGNLWRTRRFIDLALDIDEQDESHSDLLGAAIVFLHATLEEFLRSTALREWPNHENERLQAIIKKYNRLGNKNVKLSLSDVIDYREKKFENLLIEELNSFLYQGMSFNSLGEVISFLETVDISMEKIDHEIGQDTIDNVSALIFKRHLVAHQADCSNLDADQVIVWGKSLQKFLIAISNQFGLNIEYVEELKIIRFRE